MFDVLTCRGMDPKVVNDKAKFDVAPHVAPEAGSVLALVVALGIEALFEELVGKNAGLGEAVHAHLDFDVDPSVLVGYRT